MEMAVDTVTVTTQFQPRGGVALQMDAIHVDDSQPDWEKYSRSRLMTLSKYGQGV